MASITGWDTHLGFELQLGKRQEAEVELLDRLLERYYRTTDIHIFGSDDNHNTSVSSSATMTLVLAQELTEESIRHALVNGHAFVGQRAKSYPTIKGITVDEQMHTITLDIDGHNGITWFKDGEICTTGPVVDYSDMRDSILRFTLKVEGRTFYSQAFLVGP